jgi:hypothetical protein
MRNSDLVPTPPREIKSASRRPAGASWPADGEAMTDRAKRITVRVASVVAQLTAGRFTLATDGPHASRLEGK